jgi:hypothetical protein
MISNLSVIVKISLVQIKEKDAEVYDGIIEDACRIHAINKAGS